MARPKKSQEQKQTKYLPSVGCTSQEYDRIIERVKKSGLSMTAFVRQLALEGEIKIIEAQNDNGVSLPFEVVNAIKKIGVNINQQMPRYHIEGEASPTLLSLHEKLDRILDHIIDHLNI